MTSEPFGQPAELSHIPLAAAVTGFPGGALRSLPSERTTYSGRAKGTRGSVSVTVNRHEELSDRSAPYADFGHGSLDRSSKPLQELDSSPELQSLLRSFTSCQSKCACRVVGYMRNNNKNGEKRIQAERPRVQGNPPALDRQRHRLILGYARLPLSTSAPIEAAPGLILRKL